MKIELFIVITSFIAFFACKSSQDNDKLLFGSGLDGEWVFLDELLYPKTERETQGEYAEGVSAGNLICSSDAQRNDFYGSEVRAVRLRIQGKFGDLEYSKVLALENEAYQCHCGYKEDCRHKHEYWLYREKCLIELDAKKKLLHLSSCSPAEGASPQHSSGRSHDFDRTSYQLSYHHRDALLRLEKKKGAEVFCSNSKGKDSKIKLRSTLELKRRVDLERKVGSLLEEILEKRLNHENKRISGVHVNFTPSGDYLLNEGEKTVLLDL